MTDTGAPRAQAAGSGDARSERSRGWQNWRSRGSRTQILRIRADTHGDGRIASAGS